MSKTLMTLLSLTLFSTLACSMDVKDAHAPTDPPKVAKSNFKSSEVLGMFTGVGPQAFLWPIDKWNEETEKFELLTFAEKVESRRSIVQYTDDIATYRALYKKLATEIEIKYGTKTGELVSVYQANLCYTLCDPEHKRCEPDNPGNLFQKSWKETEDPEELALIADCQQNEADRKQLKKDKKAEVNEVTGPTQMKAQEAIEAFGQAVGNKNFFTGLTGFGMTYGQQKSCETNAKAEGCLDVEPGTEALKITVVFDGGTFTNAKNTDAEYSINNLQFDKQNGFVTFSIAAIDFEGDEKTYGKLFFELELNPKGQSMDIGGNILLFDDRNNSERVGRFAVSGEIEAL